MIQIKCKRCDRIEMRMYSAIYCTNDQCVKERNKERQQRKYQLFKKQQQEDKKLVIFIKEHQLRIKHRIKQLNKNKQYRQILKQYNIIRWEI